MNGNSTIKLVGNVAKLVVLVIFLVITGFSTIYTINTGQEAVVQRFGAYVTTVSKPGINFKVPFIDKVTIVDVNMIHRIEFGFETESYDPYNPVYNDSVNSRMLTSDENIAVVETIVQYQVQDSYNYLFNVDDMIGTLKVIGESTIRRVIGSHTLDEALTENKSEIQQEIFTDLQAVCDKYESGLRIVGVQLQDVNPPTEVDEAFRDVAGAKEDKVAYINEANAYQSEILPLARGSAAEVLGAAEAYANNRVEAAKAEVVAYEELYKVYLGGQETTRTRIYLETINEVLSGVNIYIMDDENSMKLFDIK